MLVADTNLFSTHNSWVGWIVCTTITPTGTQNSLSTYHTGLNYSLELMFAKFETAKNLRKFEPTKTNSNSWSLPENITEEWLTCDKWLPQLGFKPPTFWLQVRRYSHLDKAQKIRKSFAKYLAREYREKTTTSRILMPCNLSCCRVIKLQLFMHCWMVTQLAVRLLPCVKHDNPDILNHH